MRTPYRTRGADAITARGGTIDSPSDDHADRRDGYERRAGYVEAAEFEQVIRPGFRYVIEEAGMMGGKRLWSVLRQAVAPRPEGSR